MLFQKQSSGGCLIKKWVHNNFTGKHLCQSLFFDKATSWRPETLSKRDFCTGRFLCLFWNTFWCELVDILLPLVDSIWCCCCCWCCHIKFLIKSSLSIPEYTQDCTCLKTKINGNKFINKSICRLKYTRQLISRKSLRLNFWTIKCLVLYLRLFFFLKAYQNPYVTPKPNNKKFTQWRWQQQLLTCSKLHRALKVTANVLSLILY